MKSLFKEAINRKYLRVLRKIKNGIAKIYVRHSFKHLHGPKKIQLDKHEVALIILGKDVDYYLNDVYEYHKKIGIKHFIYVDNNSSDRSIEIAKKLKNTTIFKCTANFKKYQNTIRNHTVNIAAIGGWRLCIDADELFSYPNYENIKIFELTKLLENSGYNGVVGQMLDMMPTQNLSSSFKSDWENCIAYSTENITKFNYHSKECPFNFFLAQNKIGNDEINFFFGGIRKKLFNENCCLTKHPLFKPGKGVNGLIHPHITTGLNIAPFTALIRHYKFTNNYIQRDQSRNMNSSLSHNESKLRAEVFEKNPNKIYQEPYTEKNPDYKKLIEKKFIVINEEWAKKLNLKT